MPAEEREGLLLGARVKDLALCAKGRCAALFRLRRHRKDDMAAVILDPPTFIERLSGQMG